MRRPWWCRLGWESVPFMVATLVASFVGAYWLPQILTTQHRMLSTFFTVVGVLLVAVFRWLAGQRAEIRALNQELTQVWEAFTRLRDGESVRLVEAVRTELEDNPDSS